MGLLEAPGGSFAELGFIRKVQIVRCRGSATLLLSRFLPCVRLGGRLALPVKLTFRTKANE